MRSKKKTIGNNKKKKRQPLPKKEPVTKTEPGIHGYDMPSGHSVTGGYLKRGRVV